MTVNIIAIDECDVNRYCWEFFPGGADYLGCIIPFKPDLRGEILVWLDDFCSENEGAV